MRNPFKLKKTPPLPSDDAYLFVVVSKDGNMRAVVKAGIGGAFVTGMQARYTEVKEIIWGQISQVSRYDTIESAREDALRRIQLLEQHGATIG